MEAKNATDATDSVSEKFVDKGEKGDNNQAVVHYAKKKKKRRKRSTGVSDVGVHLGS